MDNYTVDMPALNTMYKDLYKSQIWNWRTTWAVKWFAIKSLKALKQIQKG